ncbi:hypothetical protein FRC10_007381 [Ceratobasidium sp. 414]|nr:hypothetical protein FRC10_007381 [Ceratobasidium sp. 414]
MALASPLTYIRTNNYFDSQRAEFVQGDHDIVVDTTTGLILDIQKSKEQLPDGAIEINLLFLHSYRETNWEDQTTRESLVERTVRAVTHARTTLLAGFTTVRDLGTEGAGDADIHLRKCISAPVSLIPGPRYFCASRAIVSTGSYGTVPFHLDHPPYFMPNPGPKNRLYPNEQGVEGVTGAQIADGSDGCMRVVRQQIGAGVDWIKLSSLIIDINRFTELSQTEISLTDYRHRANALQTSPQTGIKSTPLWTTPEWTSLVDTAHSLGVKVAVHADTSKAALAALAAGVDTLEHGSEYDDQVLSEIRAKNAIWSPTLSVFEQHSEGPGWDSLQHVFKNAMRENAKVHHNPDEGIRFACGSDIGAFPHGENARELRLMHFLGMPANRVLQAATLGGWQCVRSMEWEGEEGKERLAAQIKKPAVMGDNEVPFGLLARGFAADIIAGWSRFGEGEDFDKAVGVENIVFVMKAGKVYKEGGRSVIP